MESYYVERTNSEKLSRKQKIYFILEIFFINLGGKHFSVRVKFEVRFPCKSDKTVFTSLKLNIKKKRYRFIFYRLHFE